MNGELLSLLGTVNSNSIIGYCIQCSLRSRREEELLFALKDMAEENPEMLVTVIGEKALTLLIQYDEC
ncbi:MAG TPA: hypothetical protein VGD17_06835 [Chitinophagaceae bacterium]